MKNRIANIISSITNPAIICIPLFLIISAVLSFTDYGFDFNKFIVLECISLVFTSLLPMGIMVFWAKKLGTDKDISNRTDRYIPMIVGIISYFIGFLICYTFKVDNFFTCLLLCYSINTGVVLLITTKWKISVHTTGMSGPIAALILLLGPLGAVLAVLYPVLIWSRVYLKKHTMAQAVTGAVQGFFLAVFEMNLFLNILNIPLGNIIPLYDSILIILAIISTPVVLGILSYIKITNTQVAFTAAEIILALLFLILTPFDVFCIYLLITLTSVLISLYAGDDFIWYKIITNQPFNTL